MVDLASSSPSHEFLNTLITFDSQFLLEEVMDRILFSKK